MRFRSKSIEELLDLQQELHLAKDEEQAGSLHQLISVNEEIIHYLKRNKGSDYVSSLPDMIRKQISYLIRYGTYLKTENQKNDHVAESSLIKVLKYDKNNPIAHYRLGFLRYKKNQFDLAIVHFESAISNQNDYENKAFRLNAQQLYHAHLYLSNAALHIAEKAQRQVEKIKDNGFGELQAHPLSPLYRIIQTNEERIKSGEFIVKSLEGERYCTKEEAETLIDDTLDKIIVFSDRTNRVAFNGTDIELLSIDNFEMLRYILLFTSKEKPAKKEDFSRVFSSMEVKKNTFIRKVSRLRSRLAELRELPEIIHTVEGEAAYYFNQQIPILIIHRSDDIDWLE